MNEKINLYIGLRKKKKSLPQSAAHKISELNLFLYFLISGVSAEDSWDVGVTFTLTWLSLRGEGEGPVPPAPKPKVRKERCLCWSWGGALPTACLYCKVHCKCIYKATKYAIFYLNQTQHFHKTNM